MTFIKELCGYTLAHGDPAFIHQHVVDAFAAQEFKESEKSIRLTFALVGLSVDEEKQFTGRRLQVARMERELAGPFLSTTFIS